MTDATLKEAVESVQKVATELRRNHEALVTKYDGVLNDQEKRLEAGFVELRTQMDGILKSQKRAEITSDLREGLTEEQRQHGKDYMSFVRRGDAGVTDILTRATQASLGNDAEGGYVASPAVQSAVERLQLVISPIRAVANVVTINAQSYKIPVDRLGATSGWVAEMEGRPATQTPDLGMIEPPMGELYANVPVTQTLLDDSGINTEQWLAEAIAERFAFAEGNAFILGDGVKKPRGFLFEPFAEQTTLTEPAYGLLGFVRSGSNTGFAPSAATTGDCFADVIGALKPGYRPNAKFLLSRLTEANVAKLKDSTGAPLWRMSLRDGLPTQLMGYPIVVCDDMPNIGANAFPVAFGDFNAGYQIVDRFGLRTLRDPYTNKPFIMIYVTKRVGGSVKRFEAIKLVRTAT